MTSNEQVLQPAEIIFIFCKKDPQTPSDSFGMMVWLALDFGMPLSFQ